MRVKMFLSVLAWEMGTENGNHEAGRLWEDKNCAFP